MFGIIISVIISIFIGCSKPNSISSSPTDYPSVTAIPDSSTPTPSIVLSESPTPSLAADPSVINNTNNNSAIPSESAVTESVDQYLCTENEDILISFPIADSNKIASVCISKNQQGYIVYRFGTKDKIELEYPEQNEDSWKKFTYSYYLRGGGTANEGLDLNYLDFENDGYIYEIYEEYSSENDKTFIGIKVINQKTGEETDLPGDSKGLKGTLISLRDIEKIKKINQ
jgi:hypothetical protein